MDDMFRKLASPQMCSADIDCVKRMVGTHVTEQNDENGSVMELYL